MKPVAHRNTNSGGARGASVEGESMAGQEPRRAARFNRASAGAARRLPQRRLFGWETPVVIRRVLGGPADAKRRRLVVGAADDLERGREPVAGEAVRQGQGAEVQEV